MYKRLILFILSLGLLCSGWQPIFADVNFEKAALLRLIVDINLAAQQKNIAFLVQNTPQHLIDSMALRLGKIRQELLDNMQMQLSQQLKTGRAMKYSLKSDDIQYNIAPNGQAYALITTVKENKRLKVESQTLAIYENAGWHLIYGGARAVQNPAFLLIYPSFGGVKFRPEKVTKNNVQ